MLVSVADEEALLDLKEDAQRRGIKSILITEPDWPNAPYTALVLEPGEAASKLCANLPLALRESAMT